jgi:hypothetical protein
MQAQKLFLLCFLFFASGHTSYAQSSYAQITSWLMQNGTTSSYYQNTSSGGASPVYTFNTSAVVANCTQVSYNSAYWWVKSNGMTTIMGPFLNPGAPTTQNVIYRFPRVPTVPVTKVTAPLQGSIGLLTNGIPIYGLSNANYWNGTANVAVGTGTWNVEVYKSEGFVLDTTLGAHPQQQGIYHTHAKPWRLYTNNYILNTSKHSAIIGYAFDGYPVYGPYGYAAPTDSTSAITRMITGYALRNIANRNTLANGTAASPVGPTINTTYPLGTYVEDYAWSASNGGTLDQYNGRWCVTPEYPNGTYAYFVTVNASGTPVFPYIIGPKYYGAPETDDITVGATITVPTTGVSTHTVALTALSISASASSIGCNGGTSNVTLTTVGGSGTRTTSPAATNLSAGTYTFTVTDAIGQTKTIITTITQPAITTASISANSVTPASGSTLSLTASSSGAVSYLWNLPNTSTASGATYSVVASASNSGVYTVTATNASGCTASSTININVQNAVLSVTASAGIISCNGGVTNVSLITSGGSGTITTSPLNNNLIAGTYTFTATDAIGTTATTSVTLTQPSVFTTAITQGSFNVQIYGTSITLNATASASATYSWLHSTGSITNGSSTTVPISVNTTGIYTLTATNANSCSATATTDVQGVFALSFDSITYNPILCNGGNTNTNSYISGGYGANINVTPNGSLTAGTYTFVATDGYTTSASTVFTITQPAVVTANITANTINVIAGNTLSLTAVSNAANFTWNLPNNTTVSGASYTAVASASGAGIYTLVAKDANNCSATSAVYISVASAPLTITATAGTVTCNGGKTNVSLTTSGGIAPVMTSIGTTNLVAGTYTFTATDVVGSTVSTVITITQPTAATVTINTNANPVTVGGTLSLTTGSSYTTYSWSNSSGILGTASSYSIIASAASATTFSLTAKDASGCVFLGSIAITTSNPIAGIKLKAKLFLAGPLNTSTFIMQDSLRVQSKLPVTEPYGTLNTSTNPYTSVYTQVNGGGNETVTNSVLSIAGNNAIIDWVFIQLRDASNASQVMATRSALLQRDGDIVDVDGTSDVTFLNVNAGNYFVSVKHRNHLAVMTASAIALNSNANPLLDFTNSATALYAKTAPNNNPSPLTGAAKTVGVYKALYAGNCAISTSSKNSMLTYNSTSVSDRAALLSACPGISILNAYSVFDVDMNGSAMFNGTAPDRLVILANCGGSLTAIVTEQLP